MTPEETATFRIIELVAGRVASNADDEWLRKQRWTNKEIAQAIVREVIAAERRACRDIALAIDSGRGNETEIARAIEARGD